MREYVVRHISTGPWRTDWHMYESMVREAANHHHGEWHGRHQLRTFRSRWTHVRSCGSLYEVILTRFCSVLRFAGDVYTELILRFAKSINSNATTLFKAKVSPWATGGGKKPAVSEDDPEEQLDTAPKRLSWNLTSELRTGIRFAETRLSDLICQNDIVALEFKTYGKSLMTRHGFSPDACEQYR